MSWSVDTKLRPQQRLDKRWVKTNLQVGLSGGRGGGIEVEKGRGDDISEGEDVSQL